MKPMTHNAKKILAAVTAAGLAITLSGCADKEQPSSETNTSTTSDTTSLTQSSAISSRSESSVSSSDNSSVPLSPANSASSTVSDASTGSTASTPVNPDNTSKPDEQTSNPVGDNTSTPTESTPESSAPVSSSKPVESTPTSKPTESKPTESKPAQSSSTPASKPTTPTVNSGYDPYTTIDRKTGKPSEIRIPEGATGEFFDQYGNPMPDNFNPDNGGYYDKTGCYVMTPAEYEQMMRDIEEDNQAIKDGTFSGTAGATQEELDELLKLWGY